MLTILFDSRLVIGLGSRGRSGPAATPRCPVSASDFADDRALDRFQPGGTSIRAREERTPRAGARGTVRVPDDPSAARAEDLRRSALRCCRSDWRLRARRHPGAGPRSRLHRRRPAWSRHVAGAKARARRDLRMRAGCRPVRRQPTLVRAGLVQAGFVEVRTRKPAIVVAVATSARRLGDARRPAAARSIRPRQRRPGVCASTSNGAGGHRGNCPSTRTLARRRAICLAGCRLPCAPAAT